MRGFFNDLASRRLRVVAIDLDFILALQRPSGSGAFSTAAGPSGASSGYAFMRAFSGSNIAERGATVTGKRSFMYCTCSLVPAAACSIGR